MTKDKYKIKGSRESQEATKRCRCYYEQKAYCCPRWCTDSQFQFMMAQPLYTIFSNYNHFTESGGMNCDGSFDPTTLCDYIENMKEASKMKENVDSEPNPIDSSTSFHLEPNPIDESTLSSPSKTNNFEIASALSSENLQYAVTIQTLVEERDEAIKELNLCKEKIASLNSRVNVLELELVAQQNHQLCSKKSLNKVTTVCSTTSTLSIPDFENILESVNTEYINLKDKYKELCKKSAKSNSLELRCALLEQENKKLHSYLSQEWNQQKKLEGSCDKLSDLENLLIEKEKIETKLINLQKDAVGKISTNLIRQ